MDNRFKYSGRYNIIMFIDTKILKIIYVLMLTAQKIAILIYKQPLPLYHTNHKIS